MSKRHPLARVLDVHAAPEHCCKRDVHAQLSPILTVAANAQMQILAYRTALLQAHLEDDSIASQSEHIDQTLAAAEREVAAFASAGRQLAKVFTQLDRYMADLRKQAADFK